MISIPGYKIIKAIGQGGMATVYLALQESVGRNVAIKVMSPSLSSDPSFSERFIKEARMASLIHPHIITVFDAGESDGQNYIVMEYADGGNLDTLIRQGITLSRTVEVISQIASALNYSAQKGFIHRDVKPENILFREDGSAILVDFGIAKAITAGTRLTTVGSTIGSPNYMSPEQARGLDLDGRSDLYSLGIVFFESLTGIKPFDASDTFVIGMKHISDPIPQLPEAFKIFQPIIDRLLAKEPADRFDNGEMLVDALAKVDLGQAETLAAAASKQQADDKTRISPSFREQETQVVATDDATRVTPQTESPDDKTRVVTPPDDVTKTMPQTKKSSAGLILSSLFVIVAAISVYFWFSTQEPDTVSPPTPVTEETLESVKPESDPKVITEVEPIIEETPEPKLIPEPAIPSLETQISELLQKAQQAISNKRYTTPKTDSAFFYYNKILSLDEKNSAALKGINALSDKYLALAESQFQGKNFSRALSSIEKGLFVRSNNQALIDLREKILNIQQAAAKPKIKSVEKPSTHKSIIKQDDSLLNVVGVHVGSKSRQVNWYAQQDFTNLLYNKILQQCNKSNSLLNHTDCINTYRRYLKQWPLPLMATHYSQSGEAGVEIKGELAFKKNEVRSSYQTTLDQYKRQYQKAIAKGFQNKSDLVMLANYTLHTSLISAIGLHTSAKLDTIMAQAIKKWRTKTEQITTQAALVNQLKKLLDGKIHIRPFTSSNSFEITPFANSLYHLLIDNLGNTAQYQADYTLQGEYHINRDGSINLDLWLFSKKGNVIQVEPLQLSKNLLKGQRHAAMFYNESFLPVDHLQQSYGFASEISIAEQSANALLITGDEASLRVKLDRSGFYFIAVHVMRKNEQFSYLLPLHIAEVPFVQVATRSAANQFVELGEFKITPPLGVEALQLVAASVNLEKYLPAYHWDEKRQQFIIDGSEGNITEGIKLVRAMANQISANSQGDGIRWQERFLVTTILDRPSL